MVRLLKTLSLETGGAGASPLPELRTAEEAFHYGLELLQHHKPAAEHAGLLAYLEQLVPMVQAVRTGGELVVPAAWERDGPAFLLICHRYDEGHFNVAVCNWGPGIDRHPARLHPATGGTQRTPSLDLKGVERERLIDSGFWLLVFRMLYLPQSTPRGPALLYDGLLPALTDMPVLAQLAGPQPASQLRWHDPPLSGDVSHAALAMAAFEALLCAHGFDAPHAAYLAVLLRWTALQIARAELERLPAISASDAVLLRLACANTAAAAASLADGQLPFSTRHAASLRETVEAVEGLIVSRREKLGAAAPPPIELSATEPLAGAAAFPMFGRMARGGSVDHLAGESEVPPVVLPAELSLVADKVSSFADVCNALRHTVQLCEVLSNQMKHVNNTYCVRIALIQHLVTSVMPLPLPADHPQRSTQCFWQSQPMRYETQADLLRLLNMVCRHFAACCFSIRVTRSFDAVRLVVVACLATLADAVMRIRTCDVPSLLCLSYSGLAEGPGGAFGFDIGSFAVESEDLQLSSPELHTARVRVLDYFGAIAHAVPEERRIFRFERSMGFGEAEALLLRQLCLHMAFPTEPAASLLPTYLSGESRLMLENFPELGFFRDIVFLFKLTMVPSSDALPDICAYMPLDAALSWRTTRRRASSSPASARAAPRPRRSSSNSRSPTTRGSRAGCAACSASPRSRARRRRRPCDRAL